MNEKISVIIPIYNVEKYLNRCLESVVNQTYQNLEIILVDDGSPDRCPHICDEWEQKDPRVVVIHKQNGGLSDARNVGMERATGEYIFFLDSDDWIHKKALEIMMYFLCKYNVDIVECKARTTDKTITDARIVEFYEEIVKFNNKEAIKALVREKLLKQTVWNKLYKIDIVKNIKFESGKYHEDEFWTYQVFEKIKQMLYIELELYYYFQRTDSIMGQNFSLKRIDAIEGRYRRLLILGEKYPELRAELKENLLFLILYYGQQAVCAKEKVKYIECAKTYLKKIRLTAKEKRHLSLSHRIWVMGMRLNFEKVCQLRNKLGLGVC